MLTRCSQCRQLVTRHHPAQLREPHTCGGRLERTSWAEVFDRPQPGDIRDGRLIPPREAA